MGDRRLADFLDDPRVNHVAALVERACAAPTNAFGYGIWTHHVVPVADLALELAGRLAADEEIVVLAALLHDYAAILDPVAHAEHHRLGATEARRLLPALGYGDGTVAEVAACIECHRGSVPLPRTSAEAECLASADAMAHIENVPALLHLAFAVRGMPVDEGAAWVRHKLERSWRKLGPAARDMARSGYEAAMLVLSGHQDTSAAVADASDAPTA